MNLGELSALEVTLWAALLVLAALLEWSARRRASRLFGGRATKERYVALATMLVPIASLVAACFLFLRFELEGATETWRLIGLWFLLGCAIGTMVNCALMVLGMLRDTTDSRILMADITAVAAGLVSLWAITVNYPKVV